jgi:hypothetical protein
MKDDKKLSEKILAFLSGELDTNTGKQLKKELRDQGYSDKELKELKQLYQELGKIPVPEPSQTMTQQFYQMLNTYKRHLTQRESPWERLVSWFHNPRHVKFALGLVYSFVLLFVGWSGRVWLQSNGTGQEQLHFMSVELQEMKKIMTYSLLNQASPSERIKAIHYLRTQTHMDGITVGALLRILNDDPNTNVRLIALDALLNYSNQTEVREGLVYSINRQDSPLLQLALTEAVIDLREKQAAGPLRQLLERPDLNVVVRSSVVSGLRYLI